MFQTRTLDRLTRIHPAVPAAIFVPVIVALVTIALGVESVTRLGLELAGGYALWTLAEYWGHRAVFHLEPADGIGARIHWIIHGVHHDHPNDPRRLVLPPVLSVPLGAAFFGLYVLVFGLRTGSGVCAGFFTGYLLYDMVHFAMHHTHPRRGLGRWLRELHMRHHFEDDKRGFGVSVPWWDMVFRTYSGHDRRSAHRHNL